MSRARDRLENRIPLWLRARRPGIVNIDADAEVFQFGDHVNDARIAQVGAVLS